MRVGLFEPGLCPPDDLMCGSPGFLTCTTPELNDCNGRGDCLEGRCFCHLGFGGNDCTIPACTLGCPDVRSFTLTRALYSAAC